MSQMATIPVFKCRKCGNPVAVKSLSTINDPSAEKLKGLMQNLSKIALCKYCQMMYNWYAMQDRTAEFYTNPHVVILNVLDFSGADYYRRNG